MSRFHHVRCVYLFLIFSFLFPLLHFLLLAPEGFAFDICYFCIWEAYWHGFWTWGFSSRGRARGIRYFGCFSADLFWRSALLAFHLYRKMAKLAKLANRELGTIFWRIYFEGACTFFFFFWFIIGHGSFSLPAFAFLCIRDIHSLHIGSYYESAGGKAAMVEGGREGGGRERGTGIGV